MKSIKTLLVLATLSGAALLGGCVAVPVAPAPGYYQPAPAYYGPAYYGPSVGVGVYGGWRGGYRGRW